MYLRGNYLMFCGGSRRVLSAVTRAVIKSTFSLGIHSSRPPDEGRREGKGRSNRKRQGGAFKGQGRNT